MPQVRLLPLVAAALASAVFAAAPAAATWTSSGGNNLRQWSDFFDGVAPGDAITGTSKQSCCSGLNYFRLRTAARPPAIYRYTLTLQSGGGTQTAVHVPQIRGSTQVNGLITGNDVLLQDYNSVGGQLQFRSNTWYGFGKQESIYYRVYGAAGSVGTPTYTSTLTSETVTPTDLGTFQPGQITFSTVGLTAVDTVIAVFDDQFNSISDGRNDDEPDPGTSLQSRLTTGLNPGVYYLAISDKNLATEKPAAPGDRSTNQPVLDFAFAVANSSVVPGLTIPFSIDDGTGPRVFAASKPRAHDIAWFKITVGGSAAPGPFSLQIPAADALAQELRPTLVWSPSPNAVSYDVVVALDPALQQVVAFTFGVAANAWTVPDQTLQFNTRYYWGVQANGPTGVQTASTPSARGFYTRCVGDADRNGAVGAGDLTIVLISFGRCAGSPGYDPRADLDGNTCIGAADLTLLLTSFGCANGS
ncbi:MAG: hypothetical protein IBJ11_06725 [Phycisphaerales bacterium]|nr:hypothetical protein [Phycisphaerales bacterium]